MAGKGAAKTSEKTEQDLLFEAKVRDLLHGVKKARNLEALREALLTLVKGGKAEAEALSRMRHPFTYPTFGGPPPAETEPALSWDKERLLVCDDGLESAVIIPRRDANDLLPAATPAPKSETRARAQNDGDSDPGERVFERSDDAPAPPQDGGTEPAPEPDPGADPDEVAKAVQEVLSSRSLKAKVKAQRAPGGGGRVMVVPGSNPQVVLSFVPRDWAKAPERIAWSGAEGPSI